MEVKVNLWKSWDEARSNMFGAFYINGVNQGSFSISEFTNPSGDVISRTATKTGSYTVTLP